MADLASLRWHDHQDLASVGLLYHPVAKGSKTLFAFDRGSSL
jgi:hypothetical protein